MPCSRTQHGLTRVGLEPPTSGSGVRGINHQATALPENAEGTPKTEITLKEGDLQTIAGILADTFRPQIKEIIGPIVDGVLKGLNDTIETLQKENKELKSRVEKLENKMDAAEQYSRRNCLRVAGVPENPLEDTDGYILSLSRAICAEVTLDDIERSHRVGPIREGQRRDIIVKFSSYRNLRKVYGARIRKRSVATWVSLLMKTSPNPETRSC